MSKLVQNSDDQCNSRLMEPIDDKKRIEGGLKTAGHDKHPVVGYPRVTIITAVFNGEKHLEETIKSIVNQTYPNSEYIIIDGGSTDGTVNIIKKYEHKISYWVSENDEGIADAFNKGVRLASGDYINFQGDGDGFYADDVVTQMMEGVDPAKDLLISGRIQRIAPSGEVLYVSKYTPTFHKRSLLFRMSLPHQGLFTHRKLFEQYGLFDVSNTFSMDYEHLLRYYANFPRVITKSLIAAKWRADGLGNGRTLEILREYDAIKKKNRVATSFVLSIIHGWTLLKYGIKLIYSWLVKLS